MISAANPTMLRTLFMDENVPTYVVTESSTGSQNTMPRLLNKSYHIRVFDRSYAKLIRI